jgi:MYXO-CTERM domain-containing protein
MSSRSLGVTFSLFLGLCAAACAEIPEDQDEQTADAQGAIRDGYTDETSKAVVGLFDSQIGGICTGSLLAPNVVLTARHCVSDMLGEENGGILCGRTKFSGKHGPESFFVTTDTEMSQDPSRYHTVREVVLLPSDDGICGNDQAILILSDSIPSTEAVPLVPRVDVPLAPGEKYHAVGYGVTDDVRQAGSGLRRRRDNLAIDCVADGCPKSYVSPTEWVGEAGVCQGDSGGPSLDSLNRVTGVTSRGGLGCSSPVYGYVFGWAQWLKDTTLYAASLGGYAAPAWASGFPTDPAYVAEVGGACTAAEQCGANACLNGYCTRPCNAIAACPGGYTCEGEPGFCAKVPEQPASAEAEPEEDDSSAAASCSAVPGHGATKRTSWFTGAAMLSALAMLRRRRERAPRG